MTKKTDIPTNCTCIWEKRIVFIRGVNGARSEDEQAELTILVENCDVHKGKN